MSEQEGPPSGHNQKSESPILKGLREIPRKLGFIQKSKARPTLEEQLRSAGLPAANKDQLRPTTESQVSEYRANTAIENLEAARKELEEGNSDLDRAVYKDTALKGDIESWEEYKKKVGLDKDPE